MAVDILWDEKTCAHAGVCVKSLPQVFKVENGAFVITASAASDAEVRATVAKCPTGALTIGGD